MNHDDIIYGRNAVTECLESGREINKAYVQKGANEGSIRKLLAKLKERRIPVSPVAKEKLDELADGERHQGIVLSVAVQEYATVEDILKKARERGEAPFVIVADGIEDPHNLGAIIRTANAAGAHGVIIPKRRAVGLTATVHKTSAGALSHTPVARVGNLNQTLEQLKKEGLWIYCADMDGTPMYDSDLTGPIALVVGNEGRGVSPLLIKNADGVISIPMIGEIESLNASVSAGILAYEIVRQRLLQTGGVKA